MSWSSYISVLLLTLALTYGGTAQADEPETAPEAAEEPATNAKKPDPRPPYFSPKNTERPTPWFFAEPTVALGWWPGILAAFSPFQVRFALHRSDGLAFQDTYAGVGGWARVSPSLLEVGGRFDIAPIDVFDLAVWVRYSHSFATFAGRLPYDEFGNKTFKQRSPREDAIPSDAFEVVLEPTFKIKAGPVIGLYRASFQFSRLFLEEEATTKWVYDAARDVAVPPEGFVLLENSGVVAVDLLEHTPAKVTLRLGVMVRHRRVFVEDGDRQLNLGFIGMIKPGRRPAAPTIICQVLAYLVDHDRVLAPPQIILGAQWNISAVPLDSLLPRFHGNI
jgi:hypothetical protein